ncbi:MAG: hypothetical protein J7L41_03240 [Synergistetes bacterium]|nr:hypothetical protein [Synergistota bacterium]
MTSSGEVVMGRLEEIESLYPFNISTLRNSLGDGKVVGAYLFEGFGDAVSDVALRFIQSLLCNELSDDACGECKNCRAVEANIHPSVHKIELFERALSIADVRKIEEFILLPAVGGDYRVVFINGLMRYSLEAVNALLKTVEEPSRDVVFVVVVPYRYLLPKTFVSRCQIFYFPSVRSFDSVIVEYAEKILQGRLSVEEIVDISLKWDRRKVSELLNYIAKRLVDLNRPEDAARLIDISRNLDTYNLSIPLVVDSVILESIGGI